MKTQFTYLHETSETVIHDLHFIASIVSDMTIRHDCLVDFEERMSYIKLSLFYLRKGCVDSLTFGFRVLGFDYASTKNYNPEYRKDKGDLVVRIICTFDGSAFRLEYSSLFNIHINL